MLVRIARPDCPQLGQTLHVPKSQEIALLVALGDIQVLEDPEAAENVRAQAAQPQFTPGWSIVMLGDQKIPHLQNVKPSGERLLYADAPKPARVWRHDPATGAEGYVLQPTDCPPELLKRFSELKGQAIDPEFEAEERRQERCRIEGQMSAQTTSGHKLY